MTSAIRKIWNVPESLHTPESVFFDRRRHRREFLRTVMAGSLSVGIGGVLSGCSRPTDEQLEEAGRVEPLPEEFTALYPAERNTAFEYGRPETDKRAAAEYTNFYEFTGPSQWKDTYNYVDKFEPTPWAVEIGGLVSKPQTLDLDDLYRKLSLEERAYRHRCVETWAMCVPWTGFRLRDLLALAEPQPAAKYVAMETFHRPDQAPYVPKNSSYPWPYQEGLTIDEATNELAFIALGVYGEPLPKQHGAPLRLVIPWKYGFKSIKSIVKITLTDEQPATFWNTLVPNEYDFQANVDPDVPHPRWSQKTEWMLGTKERYPTKTYNGYGEYVGGLYPT
ncbi:protein-methionine-sulfoxide reductase catalytic subunit MsrP [Maioricimonas sp. JC845]|uniref:protein-methionine-sulfoxide reductase catalytic subunit MsrP n=1 Tax=Maioricimonas sp. JC845 TaxID=3232138 RepID=UPI0034590D09